MWVEEFHGRRVLRELAWIAGKIRAVNTVPSLLKIVIDHRNRLQRQDVFFDTADIVFSAVTGFAVNGDERIERAYDDLFHDPAVAPQFSSLLALGISICNPGRFVESFDRFFLLQSIVPAAFVPTEVIAQFADHLTTNFVRGKLNDLSDDARDYAIDAGYKAELWKLYEVGGTGPVPQLHPQRKPIECDNAYEKARGRIDFATRLAKGKEKFVLDRADLMLRRVRLDRASA
jgi:hypothetical protein